MRKLAAQNPAHSTPMATLCNAWPTLPAAVRAGILAMVEATKT
jgi:hypothetical protein